MESIRLFICALLLSPVVALAQAEEPEGTPEESAAEEAVVEEAPADEAAPDEAAAEESAAVEEVAPEEGASEEQGDTAAADGPAGPRGGHQVDVFFIPSSEIDQQVGLATNVERGDGFGGRGLFRFMQHFAASGEYQSQKFGDSDEIELTQQRLGLGFVGDNDDGSFFGLFVEYDKFEFEDTDVDGYSLHGRLSGNTNDWLGFYGDLGYLRVEDDLVDFSGHELTLGVLFRIYGFGVFADARRTDLEGKDGGGHLGLTDLRAGVRYEFGAIKPE